jgi:putative FmdB family regulatory protein
MPIYEYECPKCGRFEVVQKVSDNPLKKNPDCCEKDCPNKAERLISAAAFHLKGSGWYKTDYKPSGSAGTASSSTSKSTSESSKASDSGSSDAASTDAKPKKALKTTGGGGGGCGSGCGCH